MTRRKLVVAALSLLLGGFVLHGMAGAAVFPKERTPDEQLEQSPLPQRSFGRRVVVVGQVARGDQQESRPR